MEELNSEAISAGFRPDEAIASLFNPHPQVVKEEMRNVDDDSMRVQLDLPDSLAAASQALCSDMNGTAGEEALLKPSEHAATEEPERESCSNSTLARELVSFIRAKYQILYGRCDKADKEEAWRWVIEQCRNRNHAWVVGKGYHYLRKSKWPGIKADAVRRYIEEKMTGKERLTEIDKYVLEFISKETVEQAMRQALSLKLYEGMRQAQHAQTQNVNVNVNGRVANNNSLIAPDRAGATATAFDTAMLGLPCINADDGISSNVVDQDDEDSGENESEDPTNQPDDFGEQQQFMPFGFGVDGGVGMSAPRSYHRPPTSSSSIRSVLGLRKKNRLGGSRFGITAGASHHHGQLAPARGLAAVPTPSSSPRHPMFNNPPETSGVTAVSENEKLLKRASLKASLKALNAQAEYYRLKCDLVRYQIQLAREQLSSLERS